MSNNIKFKRSAVPSKVPETSALDLGELAINTYDGHIYLKKSDGSTEEVVRTVTNNDSATLTSLNLSNGTANGVLFLNGSKAVTSDTALTFDGTNLGIGTTTPGDAFADSIPGRSLDVVTNDQTPEIRIINESAPTSGRYPSLFIMNYGTNAYGAPALNFLRSRGTKASPLPVVNGDVLLHVNGRGQYGTALNQSRQAAYIHFRVDGNPTSTGVPGRIEFSTNVGNTTLVTERMRITSTGNVGIGTSAPASLLHVNGDITVADKIIHSGDINTSIRFPTADTFTVETGGTERVRVDSAGNVGIGTATPSQKLDVSGTAKANEFRVSSTGQINEATATTTSTTETAIATWAVATFGGGKLLIEAKDSVNRHITEMLITHDGTTAIATEYGLIHTAGQLATYDVDISGGNVRLLATPTSGNSTVFKVLQTLMFA